MNGAQLNLSTIQFCKGCCAFAMCSCLCAESAQSTHHHVDWIDADAKANASLDDYIALSLLTFVTPMGWCLFDNCLDNPVARPGKMVVSEAKSTSDDKRFQSVYYTDFSTALADGMIETGDLLPRLKGNNGGPKNKI
jgi:hypothetical protein